MRRMARPQVVIVGGGFGGLACARKLDGEDADVLLVDNHNYHLFTPLLYQVATALLNTADVAYPFRKIFRRSRNVRYHQAYVTGIDFEGRRLTTHTGAAIAYDYLVLATGSTNNYYGNREVADATLGMKTLEEASRLRNHVLSCLEYAERERDAERRRPWLTFVVVGGGPTGVEYAGALRELLRIVLGRDYPELRLDESRIVLVEGQDRVLGMFHEKLSGYARRQLGRRGIEVKTGTLVRGASGTQVELSTGETIATRTVVWSAGVRPFDPAEDELSRSRTGRIQVDDRLRIPGRRGAFAIGDAASVADGDGELPMVSPPAMQGGRYVARVIAGAARGRPIDRAKPFHYVDKGTMATIGRNAAVAQIKGLRLRGFFGWVTWLTVHLWYVVGFRNRLAVFARWAWTYVKKDRPIRLIMRVDADQVTDELVADFADRELETGRERP
jgi:NADH dehydrogenase